MEELTSPFSIGTIDFCRNRSIGRKPKFDEETKSKLATIITFIVGFEHISMFKLAREGTNYASF